MPKRLGMVVDVNQNPMTNMTYHIYRETNDYTGCDWAEELAHTRFDKIGELQPAADARNCFFCKVPLWSAERGFVTTSFKIDGFWVIPDNEHEMMRAEYEAMRAEAARED